MLLHVDLNANRPQNGGVVREIQQEREIEKLMKVGKLVLAGATVVAAGAAWRLMARQVTKLNAHRRASVMLTASNLSQSSQLR